MVCAVSYCSTGEHVKWWLYSILTARKENVLLFRLIFCAPICIFLPIKKTKTRAHRNLLSGLLFCFKNFQNMHRYCNTFVAQKCFLLRTWTFITLNKFVYLPLLYLRCFCTTFITLNKFVHLPLLYLRCFWTRDVPHSKLVPWLIFEETKT